MTVFTFVRLLSCHLERNKMESKDPLAVQFLNASQTKGFLGYARNDKIWCHRDRSKTEWRDPLVLFAIIQHFISLSIPLTTQETNRKNFSNLPKLELKQTSQYYNLTIYSL